MINAMIPIFLTFILFAAFQVDGYKDEALGAILFILVCLIDFMYSIVGKRVINF